MSAMPELLEPGTVLGSRYSIVSLAGSGGSSHVYLARDLKLPGKVWAIKQTLSEPGSCSRMEEETAMLIALDHPRLPRIVDFFPADHKSHIYLVMDYLEGITLEQYIRRVKSVSGEQLIQIAEQVCDGLHYLHTREPPIIHRDLKPSNMMIESDGQLRFIDFGTARAYKPQHSEDTVKLGTVGFAAPEQYSGKQSDARTDLYALGAVLLYLASGGEYSELTARPNRPVRKDLPLELMRIIRKLLSYHPDDRFQSAFEVRVELEKLKTSSLHAGRAAIRERPTVIAVAGACSGLGATHLSLLLAHSLAGKFSKTTVIEWSAKSKSFVSLFSELAADQVQTGKEFMIGKVAYLKKPTRSELLHLYSRGGGLVVIDLGCESDKDGLEEFARADLQLVVIPAAPWRRKDLEGCIRRLSAYEGRQRVYAVPGAGASLRPVLRLLKGSKVYGVPVEPDPFAPGEGGVQWTELVCSGLLPKQRRSFVWRWGLKGYRNHLGE
ncbi:serine/threonine-protein kinase [Paenibacillus caui]|uniref:serine/threonine-protein kinase n=1 Tax=Paenibacillus caui TaxID=2873927 RepID=UPI001CA9373E|nr:serine/threonine-protein kinase [Paenibacillus caui]